MKKTTLLFIIIALLSAGKAQSQDTLRLFSNQKSKTTEKKSGSENVRNPNEIQTLTGPGRNVGFYFGFSSGYSQIDGYDAFSAGTTLALIANHGLAIGFSGKGFFSEPYENIPGSNTSYGYTGGYGGFFIEPIIFPKFPVHVSFPIILGGGGIARSRFVDFDYPYDYTEFYIEDTEAFLIAEPGIEVEFNVARWMRLAVGGSYRITTSLEPGDFNSNPLNGFTGGLSLKFGMF
ncbi:MAG: hypothetical protein AB9834_11725 [Lentimicrobium sp.]